MSRTEANALEGDVRALPVVLLGLVVAVVPVALVPFPGDGGPITFVIRLLQAVAGAVGLGVSLVGYRAYRTGDLRPAAAAGTAILGLTAVAVGGGLVETRLGVFVPIWVWAASSLLVVGTALKGSYRLLDHDEN